MIEAIAKVAHEINRAYCLAIGDDTQPTWDEAPDWQKESALKGVSFHLANPDATPENSHESWLAQKQADGWKYGEVKDAEKKEHPCFRPYAELPAEQKAKDYLFRQTVHSLAPLLVTPSQDSVVEETPEGINVHLTKEINPVITPGMEQIDVDFNVGQRADVYAIKLSMASAIDVLDNMVAEKLKNEVNQNSPTASQSVLMGKVNRLAATAKTHIEIASMLAVKAITRS